VANPARRVSRGQPVLPVRKGPPVLLDRPGLPAQPPWREPQFPLPRPPRKPHRVPKGPPVLRGRRALPVLRDLPARKVLPAPLALPGLPVPLRQPAARPAFLSVSRK